jgi:hypothetical protein
MSEPYQNTVWVAGAFTASNLPNDAVLARTEVPVAAAMSYLGMRAARRGGSVRLFRPGDAAVAVSLGIELGAETETPQTREPEASSGEAGPPVSYFRVLRARFIALGSDGKRIACVDA